MVAMENTHLLTLSKQVFDKITVTYRDHMLKEKIEFLQRFPFFMGISSPQLSEVLKNVRVLMFKNKDVVFQEKQSVNNIYFIKQGEVILSKTVSQQLKILEEEDEDTEHRPDGDIRKYRVRNQQNAANTQKRIDYAYLGPNTAFGDEEILLKKNERESKALVVSNICELFSLAKEVTRQPRHTYLTPQLRK